MADPSAKALMHENHLRYYLGEAFEQEAVNKGISRRKLAKMMGSSTSQVQRVLHHNLGGSLSLLTICRAAEALGLDVTVSVQSRRKERGD